MDPALWQPGVLRAHVGEVESVSDLSLTVRIGVVLEDRCEGGLKADVVGAAATGIVIQEFEIEDGCLEANSVAVLATAEPGRDGDVGLGDREVVRVPDR